MSQKNRKTLRLLMPQWQGGNNAIPYPLGARLLAWLAPASDAPLVEVPVEEYDGHPLPLEDGVAGKSVLLKQLRAARKIIEAYEPDRLVVFGGDCLVSQAPFAYLNERYAGKLGLLWIDAHPDVSTPADFSHEHAMVLGNLLGEGDPDFAAEVKLPLQARRVLLAGLDETLDYEALTLERLKLARLTTEEIAADRRPVLQWIRKNGIRQMAVHLDLDVLDPRRFRSLLFNNPDSDVPVNAFSGKLTFAQVSALINEAAGAAEVVGLSIAEHMPWDAINLKNMLEGFSFLS